MARRHLQHDLKAKINTNPRSNWMAEVLEPPSCWPRGSCVLAVIPVCMSTPWRSTRGMKGGVYQAQKTQKWMTRCLARSGRVFRSYQKSSGPNNFTKVQHSSMKQDTWRKPAATPHSSSGGGGELFRFSVFNRVHVCRKFRQQRPCRHRPGFSPDLFSWLVYAARGSDAHHDVQSHQNPSTPWHPGILARAFHLTWCFSKMLSTSTLAYLSGCHGAPSTLEQKQVVCQKPFCHWQCPRMMNSFMTGQIKIGRKTPGHWRPNWALFLTAAAGCGWACVSGPHCSCL